MRPTEPHAKPCRHCPSAHHPPDDEAIDQREFIRQGLVTAEQRDFPCAWRPEALCRGWFDFLRQK